MPVMGPTDSYKYLGILVSATGKGKSYGHVLEEGLSHLRRAPLKPQQRLAILVNHLIPTIMHRLVVGSVYRTQLSRMDRVIRVAVRGFLKLPGDTPDAMLYAAVGDGGLGVPNLHVAVALSKQGRLERLLVSTDPAVRAAAGDIAVSKEIRYWSSPPLLRGVQVRSGTEAKARWSVVLKSHVDDRGMVPQATQPCNLSKWVMGTSSLLSGRDYVDALAARCATLPTPLRRSRGRPEVDGR